MERFLIEIDADADYIIVPQSRQQAEVYILDDDSEMEKLCTVVTITHL